MPATLTIDVPEEVLERLRRRSAEEGKTLEAFAAEHLAALVASRPSDPLLGWAGAFQSDVPDAAERHDHYLGQALHQKLQGGPGQ